MQYDRVLGHGIRIFARIGPRLGRVPRLALGGVALLVLLLLVGAVAFGAAYDGRVYPGVYFAGRDLSGRAPAEVRALVAGLAPPGGPITLRSAGGAQTWTIARADLGMTRDAAAVATAAAAYGRSGDFLADWGARLAALSGGWALDAPSRTDPAAIPALVARLAAAVDRPAVPARLAGNSGIPDLVPGRPGQALDQTLAARLLAAAAAVPGPLPTLVLPVHPVPPDVPDAAFVAARAAAQALVARPLTVTVAGRTDALTLAPDTLTAALVWAPDARGVPAAHLDPARIRAMLAPLAARVQVAPRNATVQSVRGTPALVPDVLGWALDLDTAMPAVIAAAATPERHVTLPLVAVPAAVPAAAVQPLYTQWQALVAQGLTLEYGGQHWTIRGPELDAALALAGNQGGGGAPYRLTVDPSLLAEHLVTIADAVDATAHDARYRLVDGAVQVAAPSQPGAALDAAASQAAVAAALAAGRTAAMLVVTPKPAAFGDTGLPPTIATPDLLGQAQTTYYGSSPERAHNVEFGTALVDGALVAPGQEFDLNATLGPLTLDAGFEMGWAIMWDGGGVTTVPAEAGGICQVATTLFQSVFWAGMPITERHHHSYWIASYGRAPSGLQGLDATIAPPDLDFRWRNGTDHWVLIRAHAANGVVHFEVWGTAPGWKVHVAGPVITDPVPTSTSPIYQASSAVPRGKTLQVEHAQPGFTADIHRQVFDSAGRLIDDWHASGTYQPSHNRFVQGSGTR